jgi:hypothetical protein
MTVTLHLPPDLETRAKEQAARLGKSVPDFVLDLVRTGLAPNTAAEEQEAGTHARTERRAMGSACGLIDLAPDFFAPLPADVEEAFWS